MNFNHLIRKITLRRFFSILYIAAICFGAAAIMAEKIQLKDGGVVRGKVVKETDTELIIANEYGNITIEKANIAKREGEKTDIPSFANSEYSWSVQSWPKFAVIGSLGVGLVVTTLFMDSIDPLGLILSVSTFGASLLTFAALDYFIYGRVPIQAKKKFNVSYLETFQPLMTDSMILVTAINPQRLRQDYTRVDLFRYQF